MRGPWLAGLLALAGCFGQAPPPPEPVQVLVLVHQDVPVVARLREVLQARASDARVPNAKIVADIRRVGNERAPQDVARELAPSLSRYRAVFATNLALARAVQIQNARIPIVFVGAANPVDMCLVDTLQRPGRNATGHTAHLASDEAKMAEFLIDAFPSLKTIVVLVSSDGWSPGDCSEDLDAPAAGPPCTPGLHEPDDYLRRMTYADDIRAQAAKRGVAVKFFLLCGRNDLQRLPALEAGVADVGVMVLWQNVFFDNAAEVVAALGRTRHPAVYPRRFFAELGGTLAVEPIRDPGDSRVAADMLMQVLDGRSPATLPVQMPRGFRATINADAAAAVGLRPSLAALRRADEVISGGRPGT